MRPFDFFAEADRLTRRGEPFATATVVRVERPTSGKPGDRAIVTVDGVLHGWIGGSCTQPVVVTEALAALQAGESRLIRLSSEPDGGEPREGMEDRSMTCFSGGTVEIFIESHTPVQLLIVGDQPVGRALAGVGRILGYRVIGVSEPGGEGELEGADESLQGWEAMEDAITPATCVVVASHGDADGFALEHALGRGAPYVGLVASGRRAESIREHLRKRGVGDDALGELRAPAGLDLRGRRPEEIALSIVAQIVQILRAG